LKQAEQLPQLSTIECSLFTRDNVVIYQNFIVDNLCTALRRTYKHTIFPASSSRLWNAHKI